VPIRCRGAEDAAYLQRLEQERQAMTGPTAEYYRLNRGASVDPLYNEPSDPLYGGTYAPAGGPWGWFAPFDLVVLVEFQESDNKDVSVREEGQDLEWDAILRVAELAWVAAAPTGTLPKEDDVLAVFGHYWDVVKVGRSGNVLDTATTVAWTLNVKRREKFTPERRLP
jgi:hypothetical protein